MSASTHAASSALTRNLPYDAFKDFAPISLIGILPARYRLLSGAAGEDVAELVALAKIKPKSLNNAWAATLPSLRLAVLQRGRHRAQSRSYKGSGQAAVDLVEGRIDLHSSARYRRFLRSFATASSAHWRSRAPSALDSLPNVPTVTETLLPGFDTLSLWLGFAPHGHAAADHSSLQSRNR